MHTVGVDLIEIERIRATLDKFGERFLKRIYTDAEVTYCRGRVPELAVRFAAKEAVMKALGTGARGVGWREIETLAQRSGKPFVVLHGRAKARAERIGLKEMGISLTHSKEYGIASVVGEMNE